jgi:hypothetical protein
MKPAAAELREHALLCQYFMPVLHAFNPRVTILRKALKCLGRYSSAEILGLKPSTT